MIGPTRPWHLRSKSEDLAHEHRQLEERMDYEFSSPAYLAELTERVEAEKARTVPYRETMETALYGNETLTPANVRYGSRARRRGMRNDEEYGA
jgi:hypothetical protein